MSDEKKKDTLKKIQNRSSPESYEIAAAGLLTHAIFDAPSHFMMDETVAFASTLQRLQQRVLLPDFTVFPIIINVLHY